MYTAIVNLTDFAAGSVGVGEGWVAPAGAGVVGPRDPLSRGLGEGWVAPAGAGVVGPRNPLSRTLKQ